MDPNDRQTPERSSWKQTGRRLLWGLVVGGIAFWFPSVLWHVWRAENFRGRDVVALTVALPLVMFAAARFMQRRVPQGRAPNFMPVAACIGMWIFGPIAIMVSASASGGGFAIRPVDWDMLLVATAIFPATTFTMSTYDGTLGALVLATLVLILVAAAGRPTAAALRRPGPTPVCH